MFIEFVFKLVSGSLFFFSCSRHQKHPEEAFWIHASGVLDFLLDRTALWVGGLRKVGIEFQLRHIELHRVT